MAMMVGKPVPDLEVDYWARGAPGPRQMSLKEFRGKWVVLFFYARDFTYICPTEVAAFADLQNDFARENAVVIGASTDSYFSHETWFQQEKRLRHVDFPVIADTSHKMTKAFDLLLEDGSALRGSFIIDPDGIVRHMTVNELDVARNMDETLRVLQALQSGDLCPVGWQVGEESQLKYNEWLAKVFPRLKKSVLADASKRLKTVLYEAGDIIINQGDKPDRFYIIVGGQVSVIHRNKGGEDVRLARLGQGEVFGEMGILTETRRSADVRADTNVTVLALDWHDFKTLVNQSSPTTGDFMTIVEQRRSALPG